MSFYRLRELYVKLGSNLAGTYIMTPNNDCMYVLRRPSVPSISIAHLLYFLHILITMILKRSSRFPFSFTVIASVWEDFVPYIKNGNTPS